jgi:hypothetical protein
MYPSILSFETINKPKLFFERGIPKPQDVGAPSLAQLQKKTSFQNPNAVLENVSLGAGLQKRDGFSTLNVGLKNCVKKSGFLGFFLLISLI